MADAVTLAREHMADQVRSAAAVEAGLAAAWTQTMNPRDLDRTFPTFLRSALALVSAGRGKAEALAVDYYGKARGLAGYSDALPRLKAPPMDVEALALDLMVNGPVAVKKQMTATPFGTPAAMAKARTRVLGVGKRHTLHAGRDAIIRATKDDKNAVAWARVSDGRPCSFCAMLVGRGPVYSATTVRFRAHNRCGCSVRPVFAEDADGGWSPDALALNNLWNGKDADGNYLEGHGPDTTRTLAEWRAAYKAAADDPEHEVFKAFSDNVAKLIADPAIKAAKEAATTASTAYAGQLARKRAAELAAKRAQDEAERAAAAAAAEAAKKEAAKIKKWQGKPPPVKPVPPTPPATIGAAAFDDFLEASKKRFADFAAKTGNPKNDLTKSLNWEYFRRVVDHHDVSALDYLAANHYIDGELRDMALAAIKRADEPLPGAAEAYKKALRSFKNRSTRHARYLEEWREVNGITTAPLEGMDGVVHFDSTAEALSWAEKNLHIATGRQKDAIQRYTGSDYTPWNAALRKSNSVEAPEGRWKASTLDADEAFRPAPTAIQLVRGTNWDEFEWGGKRERFRSPEELEALVGTVQTQQSYWSSSMGHDTQHAAFGGAVQLRLRVPEGHPVTYAMPYSLHRSEREVVIKRQSSYFIHAVYKPKGASYHIVEAEVLPYGEDPTQWADAVPQPRAKPFERLDY